MKKLALRISQATYSDLENIWVYISKKWSPDQADRYYDLILEEINFLRTNYNAGKSAENIRKNYKVSFVKSHIIFYRIVDDKILEIIRILHQRMNIDKWLVH